MEGLETDLLDFRRHRRGRKGTFIGGAVHFLPATWYTFAPPLTLGSGRMHMPSMANERVEYERKAWTIAVVPEGSNTPRKLTKIMGLNGSGFSVLTPYHKNRSGFLFKMPVEPRKALEPGTWKVAFKDCFAYTAESRVKLSYHVDGFAQFSSERQGEVISGRDPVTGTPKGLGLISNSLSDPISSGPSVSITAWGLDDFEPLEEQDDALIFDSSLFHYRGCTPRSATGTVLQIFAIPVTIVPPTHFRGDHALVEVAAERLGPAMMSVQTMSLLHLPREKVFLGLVVNRAIVRFPSASGWSLQGPGDWRPGSPGHVLMALYPRDSISVAGRPSLDRDSVKK